MFDSNLKESKRSHQLIREQYNDAIKNKKSAGMFINV